MKIGAVAFDAYGTLFDVYSVGALAEQLFPGKGPELTQLWRLKQIEYTQVRTLAGRYKPFWEVTQDALDFACRRLGLEPDAETRARLMGEYDRLAAFPENLGALKALKALGLRLAILSNGTRQMLEKSVSSSGMTGLFDQLLSVDAVGKYKTHPDAYRLGTEALNLAAPEILFVSSNCWDVAGATWFGYTTFWINRGGQPLEQLDFTPAATGKLLTDVVAYVEQHARTSG